MHVNDDTNWELFFGHCLSFKDDHWGKLSAICHTSEDCGEMFFSCPVVHIATIFDPTQSTVLFEVRQKNTGVSSMFPICDNGYELAFPFFNNKTLK